MVRTAPPTAGELIPHFRSEPELTGRMNWSGAALSTFYSAVRHALVVAIIIRAIGAGLGLAGLAWVMYRYGGGAKAEL